MYAPTEEILSLSTSNIDIKRMAKTLHDKLENAEHDKLNVRLSLYIVKKTRRNEKITQNRNA